MSAEEGPGGESECEEGVRDEVRAGQDDDAGDDEARRAPIVHEPRPSVGVEGDGGVEERDWSCVSVEERLCAAGAALVTADRLAGVVPGGGARVAGSGRMLYNPLHCPYADKSVVHLREFHRLEQLMKVWKGEAVADGDDGVSRGELDGWQKFAHDIVARRGRETTRAPVRCFMIGTAGTGKSRTVRSFVGAKRLIVRRHVEAEFGPNALQFRVVQEKINNAVRYCCQLGAPTCCASFQLKFGASTLHRLFGVPIVAVFRSCTDSSHSAANRILFSWLCAG